jgi:RimJ/RimL family protein N-acetyltransferase
MLATEHLILRPFTLADAPAVQQLAGARAVALNTLLIPHPYPDGAAEEWIARHGERSDDVNFAITLRQGGDLIGAIGLIVTREHDRAEIGYWIGVPYWNNGYATEAARAVIDYGFARLGLQRIFALYFKRNPASGRVMRKLGMQREGLLRRHVLKWDERIDVEIYAILREEWAGARTSSPLPDDLRSDG